MISDLYENFLPYSISTDWEESAKYGIRENWDWPMFNFLDADVKERGITIPRGEKNWKVIHGEGTKKGRIIWENWNSQADYVAQCFWNLIFSNPGWWVVTPFPSYSQVHWPHCEKGVWRSRVRSYRMRFNRRTEGRISFTNAFIRW